MISPRLGMLVGSLLLILQTTGSPHACPSAAPGPSKAQTCCICRSAGPPKACCRVAETPRQNTLAANDSSCTCQVTAPQVPPVQTASNVSFFVYAWADLSAGQKKPCPAGSIRDRGTYDSDSGPPIDIALAPDLGRAPPVV